jgi:xylose isomerase
MLSHDFDALIVIGVLRPYGPVSDFKVNVEANLTTGSPGMM